MRPDDLSEYLFEEISSPASEKLTSVSRCHGDAAWAGDMPIASPTANHGSHMRRAHLAQRTSVAILRAKACLHRTAFHGSHDVLTLEITSAAERRAPAEP